MFQRVLIFVVLITITVPAMAQEREENFTYFQEGKEGTGKRRVITVDLGGGEKMEFVRIKAGEFWMGAPEDDKDASSSEKPRHKVKLTQDYYLAKYTVMRGQFRQFVKETGYKTEAETDGKGGWGYDADDKDEPFKHSTDYSWKFVGYAQGDDHPVVNVTWNDAQKFVEWLRKKSKKSARLPSEAEWEFACRAGSETKYYCGDDKEQLAIVGNVADASWRKKFPKYDWNIEADDGYVFTAPVGRFKANKFGLHDMHGNVYQWCQDWYSEDYYKECEKEGTIKDPQGPKSEQKHRVVRGGSLGNYPRNCRCEFRYHVEPGSRHYPFGLRVLLPLD